MLVVSDHILNFAGRIHPVGRAFDTSSYVDTFFEPLASRGSIAQSLAVQRISRSALEGASVAAFRAHQLTWGPVETVLPPVFDVRDRLVALIDGSKGRRELHGSSSAGRALDNRLLSVLLLGHECVVALPIAGLYLGVTAALWVPCALGGLVGGMLGAYQVARAVTQSAGSQNQWQ